MRSLSHVSTYNKFLDHCYIILSVHLFSFKKAFVINMTYELVCVITEWLPEHFADVAVLMSKCEEDIYSADVPSSLQVYSI